MPSPSGGGAKAGTATDLVGLVEEDFEDVEMGLPGDDSPGGDSPSRRRDDSPEGVGGSRFDPFGGMGAGNLKPNKDRLYIKQVIINGFKTYKDQTPLPVDFHPGSNIVVGFNGSGKSNFFNAILFVISDEFGQLSKETRKAILHEGAGVAVMTAYVEIVFCNKGRHLGSYESDEVRLKRVVGLKKDDYVLQGKHVTKSEVFNFLEGVGFSAKNPYYVIKQGKVQELTVMDDEKRLQLMKELSGNAIYEDRRTEAIKKIDEVDRKMIFSKDKMATMEKRIKELEKDMHKVKKWSDMNRRGEAVKYVSACEDREQFKGELEQITAELKTMMNHGDKLKLEAMYSQVTNYEFQIKHLEEDVNM